MTRRESREHVFKMLFRRDFFLEEEWKEQAERYLDSLKPHDGQPALGDEEKKTLMDKALAVCEKAAELDDRIDAAAEGWKTKRMGKVDVTVLRLALYEMEYDDDIPTKVAINEAVELARKFGGDESPGFVNGILARLVD
ncbi:MAG: transcription antitermination factor NusB [Lachnospiraceae bacterium]|nr:transcription antitermination factor NusB [Lachnospiraceae bacterium]